MAAISADNVRPAENEAPIYSPVDQYPTEAIDTYPPPLPLIPARHTLRSRRGVAMQVQIPRSPYQSPPSSPWQAKGHIQPHRSHLPRRRNPKRIVFVREPDTPEDPKVPLPGSSDIESPAPAPGAPVLLPVDDPRYLPNPPLNDPAVQELVSGLYVAFAGGAETLEELPRHEGMEDGQAYTHAVTVALGDGGGTTEQVYDGRVQRLRLVLSADARVEGGRSGLGLTDAQLRAARDFVAQGLPEAGKDDSIATDVRVLITTPFGRPTDALCIAMCALCHTSRREFEELLNSIESDSMLSTWRGEISGDEAEKVQKIAKAWSWMQVVQPVMH